MLQFAGIIKPKTWIIAGVALVVFVGIIVSLTGAGHRGDGSSEPQAVSQPASHPAEAVAENEMAKHGASPGKLPTPAPTAAAKEHVDSPRANVRHSVTLWNSAGNEFESNLLEAMGGRIASRRREDGRPEYLLSFGGGQGSRLRIDSEANKVLIEGREGPVRGVVQLVHALDKPSTAAGVGIRCISAPRFRGEEIKRLMQAVRMDEKSRAKGSCKGTSSENPEPMAVAFQVGAGGDAKAKQPRADSLKGGEKKNGDKKPPKQVPESRRLKAPVQVQALEGMDALIIRGHPDDVKRVSELIEQLEEFGKTAQLATEVIFLKHVDATAVGLMLKQLYEEVFLARDGAMSITPLAAPTPCC